MKGEESKGKKRRGGEEERGVEKSQWTVTLQTYGRTEERRGDE